MSIQFPRARAPLLLRAIILLTASIAISACNNASTTGNAPSISVGTEVDDAVITTRVKTALLADNDVKGLDIKVETRKGEVMLSGFADSQAQIERGILVTRGVSGVREVDNKLSLKDGKLSVGNAIDDSVVTTSVKSAILADATIKSLDVSVVTRKGEVQLSGFVDNPEQLAQAIAVTKNVQGVTSVVHHMDVKK